MLAIGVGSSVLAAEINFISSSIPGVQTAFFTADFTELSTIVNTLTAAIVSPGATNLTVEVEVLPRFPMQTATATSGAVLAAGSHVTWTLPSLGASTETLTIAHHHDGTGNGSLQVLSATYADAEGHGVTIDEPFTNVTGCNVAPVANAGNDQTIPLTGSPTAAATLDGSGSTDDGLIQPLGYNWSSNTGITASGATPSVTLPFGTHAFTLTVGDGEFTDSDTVVIDVIDPTAPVIGSTITGTPGLNGWYTSNVAVAWTTADPETGIASSIGCDPAAVLADTMGQTISCTATNGAGASSTQAVVVMRDATAPALTTSGPLSAGATSAAGATVAYAAPSASDATSGLAGPAVCAPVSGSLFPLGSTDVTCVAADRAGNQASAHFTVTVSDTTPPVIGPVVPSQSSLWPPNHKMVAISLVASATDAVSAATCAISHVSSSEPDNGLGDGDTANDIVITGPLRVELRAERRGGGPGRVYTIQVRCTDAAGNAASSSTTVAVPSSNGR
ncbi:MAG: HYR domain-containing protein, partial [Vicinamibacterales bacterium]